MAPSNSSGVDPEILVARARQAANAAPVDIMTAPTEEARRLTNAAAAVFNDGGPALAAVETLTIPAPAGSMRARLYWPMEKRAAGAILYLHGGGWFNCNVDTHDRMMRTFALDSGLMVMGIDYRLSPEHPFPAALNDAIAAWRWLLLETPRLGLDKKRLCVSGDSAGANLALALSICTRDANEPTPAAAALFYGCFAPNFDLPSHARNGDGRYGLTTARMRWYWQQYLGPHQDAPSLLATPLLARLEGLGPVYLNLAEFDAIADDTRLLAERLRAAGVTVEIDEWEGAVHGFMQMTLDSALARRAVAKAATTLTHWLDA